MVKAILNQKNKAKDVILPEKKKKALSSTGTYKIHIRHIYRPVELNSSTASPGINPQIYHQLIF